MDFIFAVYDIISDNRIISSKFQVIICFPKMDNKRHVLIDHDVVKLDHLKWKKYQRDWIKFWEN